MVANTGAMFKTFTFDNENSRNYGVYITGEAVFNAPDRDVEMITIPGRNGSFAKDNGRFENIAVTYPAGVFADSESDFADAISDLRNMLCSKKGYCRLQDDYNPNEFRLAVYKSGLEVDPSFLRAGEFSITFECKPQRFLTSGETKTAISSGGTITNPTLFDAKPLLEFNGYGTIHIGSDVVRVQNGIYGSVVVGESVSSNAVTINQPIITGVTNAADILYPDNPYRVSVGFGPKTGETITDVQVVTGAADFVSVNQISSNWARVDIYDDFSFNSGTPINTGPYVQVSFKLNGTTYTETITSSIYYNGSNNVRYQIGFSNDTNVYKWDWSPITIPNIFANSTKTILNPKYIDLDIGEAWNEVSGNHVPINNMVSLPTKLSVLEPGSNGISYSNTITNFKIAPRWWKI